MTNSRFRPVFIAATFLSIVVAFLFFTHYFDGTTQTTRPYSLDFAALGMSWGLVACILAGIHTAWTELGASGEDFEHAAEVAAAARAIPPRTEQAPAGHSRAHA